MNKNRCWEGILDSRMASEKLPINLIGIYQDAFMREAGSEGSVDSSQVSSIMKSVGLNPSEAEIQVGITRLVPQG